MLTTMEAALLKARGYEFQRTEALVPRGYRAIAVKGEYRAEAYGSTRDAAARNVVLVVTRR